jgi:hypothetical protein
MTEGEVEVSHDRDTTSTPVFQFTTPTLKVSTMTIEVLDVGRGFARNPAIGREPVPTNRPNY